MAKRFLLGVGAQKAGTSWLYWTLENHTPGFAPGIAKEMHVWDCLTLPEGPQIRQRFEQKALQDFQKGHAHWAKRGEVPRLAMFVDPDYYFDFYARLLDDTGCDLAADISPEYAALSVETLQRIDRGFAARGIELRPVFVMREPVCRLASMVRMSFRFAKQTPTPAQEIARIRRLGGAPYDQLVSDYARTHANLCAAFGAERVHFGLHETMFRPDEVARLASHLGADFGAAEPARVVHADPQRAPYPAELVAQLRGTAYDSHYEIAEQVFGAEAVSLWDAQRNKLSQPPEAGSAT